MADLTQVYDALRKADAAGDTESAQKLADYIKSQTPGRQVRSMDITADGSLVPTGSPAAQAAAAPDVGMSKPEMAWAAIQRAAVEKGRGLGQWLGVTSRNDVAESRKLDAPLMNHGASKFGDFIGNTAITAPALLIPGANTVAGAGIIGAVTGALQPSVSNTETATNIGLGGALGAGGQAVGNRVASAVGNRIAANQAANAVKQSVNAERDATLAAGQKVGLVAPITATNPGLANNAIESVAGKAATRQEMSIANATKVNALVAEDLGLPTDKPITRGALAAVRKVAGAAYEKVASLPPVKAVEADPLTNTQAVDSINPRQMLFDLRKARNDATAWYKSYGRTASPESLQKAEEARSLATKLESGLEDYANSVGRSDLVPDMVAARKLIAKTWTAESALKGGNIDASRFAARLNKNEPLDGNFRLVAEFADKFPDVMKLPKSGAGVSNLWANLLSGGAAATAAMGHPVIAAGEIALPAANYLTRKALVNPRINNALAAPSYSQRQIGLNALQALGRHTAEVSLPIGFTAANGLQ